jgi:hypothetical protein
MMEWCCNIEVVADEEILFQNIYRKLMQKGQKGMRVFFCAAGTVSKHAGKIHSGGLSFLESNKSAQC